MISFSTSTHAVEPTATSRLRHVTRWIRHRLSTFALGTLAICLLQIPHSKAFPVEQTTRPNVVYIMADELGYFELSCLGNPNIQTPWIDQMTREGIRFTQALAGSSVCAPTRCCLMSGKHSGHTYVRTNGGGTSGWRTSGWQR